MGHLGEGQGHAQVISPFELIPKTQIQGKGKIKFGKREKTKSGLSQTSPTYDESRPQDSVARENSSG